MNPFRALWNFTMAPYKAVGRIFLDLTLGEDELAGKAWPNTTPDQFDRDHSCRDRLPR